MASPVTTKPDLSIEDARALLTDRFGVGGALTVLDGERDLNFRVDVAGRPRYVLKIANPSERPDVLDLQATAFAALAAAGVRGCPALVPTLDRTSSCTVEIQGAECIVRLLTWVEGRPLAEAPHDVDLLEDVGRMLGRVDAALAEVEHAAADRPFAWDLRRALDTVAERIDDIAEGPRRELVQRHLAHARVKFAELPPLREGLIHNDGNDWNVLVTGDAFERVRATGLIDFGDLLRTWSAAGPAIAMAYAMLGKQDPLAAARAIVAGYHAEHPILEPEANVLWEFARWRLLISVSMSARQRKEAPDNEYLGISEAPAWELLERMDAIHPRHAAYALRDACGFEPCPTSPGVVALIERFGDQAAEILPGLARAPKHVLDLSVGAPGLGSDGESTAIVSRRVETEIAAAGASIGIGRYDEVRRCYAGDLFAAAHDGFPERRTVHLGIDLFAPAGTPVHAPLDGEVWSVRDNAGRLDYGPTVILRHRTEAPPVEFFTLYGHLARSVIDRLRPGSHVARGAAFAEIGPHPENGDWPPHVHFQVMPDILDDEDDPSARRGEFPGVGAPSQRALWRSLCPDPSRLLGLGPDARAPEARPDHVLARARAARTPSNLSVSYARPLQIVRGEGAFLYDQDGQAYLDGVNNVCHVGHAHPKVVAALTRQASVLNTNTRYLHQNLTAYTERLAALFPAPLEVVFLCCSGSEANELALRLARTATGRDGVCVLDHAYHGNTGNLVDLSPYKHDGPGGRGRPDWVEAVPLIDPWDRSGPHGESPEWPPGVDDALMALAGRGKEAAAFLVEAFPGCAGQVELPTGYLDRAFQTARAHGALCIADEVQTGFGRVGTHWWAFETQDVVPDIVTMGKPIGNGHPMAAVITTRAIADAFANGMEWFNTFGGNPVSCAVGEAVLDVIETEGLRENAATLGERMLDGLRDLQARYPIIGDVRGRGLFLGAELVRDRETREPATAEASFIVNRLRDRGILLSTDGPRANVLKLKPPLVWTVDDADRVVRELDRVLNENTGP